MVTLSQALVTLAVFRLCTSDKDHCAAESLNFFPIFFIMRIYSSVKAPAQLKKQAKIH